MVYRRFEELPDWNDASELALRVYALTETGRLGRHAGLRAQLERATLPISNNSAEGFERGTHEELLTFLYIARGSSGEVRSMFIVRDRVPYLKDLSQELGELRTHVEGVARQLGRWIESIKDSGFTGTRSRNEGTLCHGGGASARRHACRDPACPGGGHATIASIDRWWSR